MGPALLLVVGGAAVAGVKKALDWWSEREETQGRKIPQAVVDAVMALRQGKATAAVLLEAAVQTETCGAEGASKLAATLRRHAERLQHAEHLAADALAMEQPEAETLTSPLEGVDDEDWTRYVRRARLARPDYISPSYRIGAFAMTAADLGDIGMMCDVHKGEHDGRKGVWLGTWRNGYSLRAFLESPEVQYEALTKLTRYHAEGIHKRHATIIGTVIAGQKVTLSGLLAVARKAKLGGLRQWVTSEEDRKAFPESGALYARFNGLF